MNEKRIELPCFGIVVDVEPGEFGSITSDLHETLEDASDTCVYNSAMDAIESIILGHAMAGIDIESSAYIEGIETAVQACADNV